MLNVLEDKSGKEKGIQLNIYILLHLYFSEPLEQFCLYCGEIVKIGLSVRIWNLILFLNSH